MSLGFSVGDFVLLGQLAWKIYKASKDAPEGFKNITHEVLSLHAVLKEVEETYLDATLSEAQRSRLRIVGDGCRAVLEDLQRILDKHNSLGTKDKRTWDRIGWGSKDIDELRSRLTSNTVLLTTFVNSSQINVQKKLDVFMQEFWDGMREGSVVSTHSVDSLSNDERQAWSDIQKELKEIGISVATFNRNKEYIMNWFKTAISAGVFEEQTTEDGSISILYDDDLSQSSEDLGHDNVLSQRQPLEGLENIMPLTSTSIDLQASILSPQAKSQIRSSPRVAGPINRLFRGFDGLLETVQIEDEMKMQRLLDNGLDINVKDICGSTLLHLAVLSKNEVEVQLLLRMRIDINAKDNSKVTALHFAVEQRCARTVQYLLENGAEIDQKDEMGTTALHWAAIDGHEMVMKLLLTNGAKIDEKDEKGNTALQWAAMYGHEMVMHLLLDNGAKIDDKDDMGNTALHWAVVHGHEMVVEFLLHNGAKVDEKHRCGYTALHWAAIFRHEMVVELLLKYGAKINEKDGKGNMALHWAAIYGHKMVMQLLLQQNREWINEKDENGNTAMHLAAKSGQETVVQLLLKNGAKVEGTGGSWV